MGGQITERRVVFSLSDKIDREREEYLVIYENLLLWCLIRVERSEVASDDRDSSLNSCLQEIIIDFLHCSVSLDSLCERLFGEVLDHLELFVPVADSSGVKAVQWDQGRVIVCLGLTLECSLGDQPR